MSGSHVCYSNFYERRAQRVIPGFMSTKFLSKVHRDTQEAMREGFIQLSAFQITIGFKVYFLRVIRYFARFKKILPSWLDRFRMLPALVFAEECRRSLHFEKK